MSVSHLDRNLLLIPVIVRPQGSQRLRQSQLKGVEGVAAQGMLSRKHSSGRYLDQDGISASQSWHRHSASWHRNTIWMYMCEYGIGRQPFSTIPDASLDKIIGDYKAAHPNKGIRYIRGYLAQRGMRVQRERIIASLSRVDKVASGHQAPWIPV